MESAPAPSRRKRRARWNPRPHRRGESVEHGGIHARAGLAALLREALRDPAIQALAARLAAPREGFDAASVAARRRELLGYLRQSDELPRFEAFFAPLLAAGNGVSIERPDGSVLFLVGPAAPPAKEAMVLVHEMAHQPVARVLARPRVAPALEASRCALDAVGERWGYESWPSYFAEVLVRAVSYRLSGLTDWDSGMRYERELTEALRRFEAAPEVRFEDAAVGMLETLGAACARDRAAGK